MRYAFAAVKMANVGGTTIFIGMLFYKMSKDTHISRC